MAGAEAYAKGLCNLLRALPACLWKFSAEGPSSVVTRLSPGLRLDPGAGITQGFVWWGGRLLPCSGTFSASSVQNGNPITETTMAWGLGGGSR